MTDAIITIRVMPENPDVDLAELSATVREVIKKNGGEVGKEEIQPIAFGLNALILTYVINEALGGTEAVETEASSVAGVQSAEVTDVRRAIG